VPTPRSAQKANPDTAFRNRVYYLIRAIPFGSVTTYGALARGAGKPDAARQVGWLVSNPPEDIGENCHRIVNSTGYLSGGWSFGHPDVMAGLLTDEGIQFKGEYRVDLKAHFWEPVLPSTATNEVNDLEDIPS
jgi:methylated-DNA-protein-cysteine methyltransferase-like protein